MVNEAELDKKCVRLEEHYQEEVSRLFRLTQEVVARIKSSTSSHEEEYIVWSAQLKRVQGLHRQFEAILKEMGETACFWSMTSLIRFG